MSIGLLAFRIGRRIGKHPRAGRLFCLVEPVLPVHRVARAKGIVAFHHPRPMENPHILIVPTGPFASMVTPEIEPEEKSMMLWRMVRLAQKIAAERTPEVSWQLVINGGARQDIGQMHGHLLISADTTAPDGIEIADPEQDAGWWTAIFAELQHAESIPRNGYSLEFRWNQQSTPLARLTQSPPYV